MTIKHHSDDHADYAISFLGIYVLISLAANAFLGGAQAFYVFGTIRASRAVHAKLITSIFRAPLR
jgi:hypothetical protein